MTINEAGHPDRSAPSGTNTSKKRKIITQNDSNKGKRDEMSNTRDKDTEEKELGTSNSSIRIHVSYLLLLLNSSALPSTKQKLMSSSVPSILDSTKYDPQSSSYQIKLKENLYLASHPFSDYFTTAVKNDNKDNNANITIEELFFNIEYRSSYKRLIGKALYETCKFF